MTALRRVQQRLPRARGAPDDAPHLVVCGDDALAHRLVEELAVQYHRHVKVILPSKTSLHGGQINAIPGVEIVEAPALTAAAFARAKVSRAEALALVDQDDVGNLHAALLAQEQNPHLRLVIRMFNTGLGYAVARLVRNSVFLSAGRIAAPAFVASALGDVAPTYTRLGGATLYVARREDIARGGTVHGKVICGLADTRGAEPVLLPADPATANLVLALADGRARPVPRMSPPNDRARRLRQARRGVHKFVARGLRIAALGLLAVLVLAAIALALVDPHLTAWQAVYETVLNAVGGAGPDLSLSGPEQLIQTVVALAGIALIPVLTAAVVEAVVNAPLARVRVPQRGHVIVVGLGNLGTRVIQQLHDFGVPLIAIDKTESARGAQLMRELRVPLIIGDASRASTLAQASVQNARALLGLSNDDLINLHAALHARDINPDLRVVLRLFDGEFAERAQRAFGITSSKSVSYLAAPAYAAAMLEREVAATIPVGRQVLLVAEIGVELDGPLVGQTIGSAQHAGAVRIIGLAPRGGRESLWQPPPARLLVPGDRLFVVATPVALSRLFAQSSAAAEPRPTGPRATEPRPSGPRATEPRATEQGATERRATEQGATERRATERRAT